ncbi:transposase [Salinibacter ruber]|uniref:transposase n=1 Tax=Salinibacter ruber TaxID=146919 RepID=UPI003C6E20C3
MTEHLKAKPGEQTLGRRRQRNGTYQQKLTTRVGTIELEVPRDREGTFFGGPLSAARAIGEGARADADAAGPTRESAPVESRRSPWGPAGESFRSGRLLAWRRTSMSRFMPGQSGRFSGNIRS